MEFPSPNHSSYWHQYSYHPAPTMPAVHVSDIGSTKYSEIKSSSEKDWQSSSEVNRILISTILEKQLEYLGIEPKCQRHF